jgi:aspartate-semialdehyde dehydrogenase
MDAELGYNEEEMKLVKETRKIWKNPNASDGLIDQLQQLP